MNLNRCPKLLDQIMSGVGIAHWLSVPAALAYERQEELIGGDHSVDALVPQVS